MNSTDIRQSFLDFFQEKKHTIVPSSSLMPGSPNLLFTNAGMNQFVPYFLGTERAPYDPARAADTQKCIRAGGKHNDLDDVGLDTYHHTFFEMLGNWSFGDYFKKEAIEWAWELLVDRWKFPVNRLYATVYAPDKSKGDPAEFDQEAYDFWAAFFEKAGLDPKIHIVHGNKKDNFWMMGETGPCGPCSEVHVDLTPAGDTKGSLVNKGDARCIEIWNLVFIQFNANPDGTFSPLAAKHVDTGMGFERVCSIIQGTKNFSDFANAHVSNYETDVFRPIFDRIEQLSGKKYASTLPLPNAQGQVIPGTEQEKIDVAFRVIADHIRTLSFAIADGIQPGNNDRNYVLRRILRRAVRYGRSLGFHEPFFYKLVDVLAKTMGDVFPEIRAKQHHVEEVLKREEEAFNRTLDTGIQIFEEGAKNTKTLSGDFVFKLYDTYGFPLDLTELLARERGIQIDTAGFEKNLEEQRDRARKAQKKEVIELSQIETESPTRFVGYEKLFATTKVVEVVSIKDKTAVLFEQSPCYAEMGGQVGDTGIISHGAQTWEIRNTQKSGNVWLHLVDSDTGNIPSPGTEVEIQVDPTRRTAIQGHHTVTHLLHWALHEVVGKDATQKGSYVGPDKLTFDFNSGALTQDQIHEIEHLVNTHILKNEPVSWTEVPYSQVKPRTDIMQFFGDKYGDTVRVVQIGGTPNALDGYSMELCAGTHVRNTGEIGAFKIISEGAIAAGVRRMEAVAGIAALQFFNHRINEQASRIAELEGKLLEANKQLEKEREAQLQNVAATITTRLLDQLDKNAQPQKLIHDLGEGSGELLQAILNRLKQNGFQGIAILFSTLAGNVHLAVSVSSEHIAKFQAGKIIQQLAPIVSGKGGGKPDLARGAGKDASKIPDAVKAAEALLQS